jgi:hypothetical protein
LKEKREHTTIQEEKIRIKAKLATVKNMILLNIKYNNNQIREKLLYKVQTMKVVQHPMEYISIIIDRMNTSNVPLKMPLTKGICI